MDINFKVKGFTDELLGQVDLLAESLVYKVMERTTKEAQRNFNRFEPEASTDNPHVEVMGSVPIKERDNYYSATVRCIGEQVIFIEFGVGSANSEYDTSDEKWEGAPRPVGVFPLGYYQTLNDEMFSDWERFRRSHLSQGTEDWWIRKTENGRLGIGEHYAYRNRHDDSAGLRSDAVWTRGHRPSRALWNAVNNALVTASQRVLNEVKIKKPKPKEHGVIKVDLFD